MEPFVTEYSANKTMKELTELNKRKEALETTMSGLEAVKDSVVHGRADQKTWRAAKTQRANG